MSQQSIAGSEDSRSQLDGEGEHLGMDAPEAMMRLGGTEVGLEVGMMQVPTAQLDINREPQEVMGNKHCDQQQEQVKEWNKIEQMILKPGDEHGQMHRKLSLCMEKVGVEDI